MPVGIGTLPILPILPKFVPIPCTIRRQVLRIIDVKRCRCGKAFVVSAPSGSPDLSFSRFPSLFNRLLVVNSFAFSSAFDKLCPWQISVIEYRRTETVVIMALNPFQQQRYIIKVLLAGPLGSGKSTFASKATHNPSIPTGATFRSGQSLLEISPDLFRRLTKSFY